MFHLMKNFLLKIKMNKYWMMRLVARGFSQKPGEDYNETFASVISFVAIRFFLEMCALQNLRIFQADVTTAFLNGDLREEVYITPPAGVRATPNKVWALHKCLYGLKQSPREWNLYTH